MEILLRLWSIASVGIVTLYAGWSLTHKGLDALDGALALLLATALTWLLSRQLSIKSRIPCILVFVSLLGCGSVAALTNYKYINEWIENSTVSVRSIVHPVTTYTHRSDSGILITDSQQQAFQSLLVDLHVMTPDHPMLVSFREGLALIKKNRVQLLTSTGVVLSLSGLLPDGSFLISPLIDPNTITSTTSLLDTLTRVQLREGTLYKIWENNTPGLYLHHWGDAFNGRIYHPGRRFRTIPDDTAQRIGGPYARCRDMDAIHDVIHTFDGETGQLLQTFDILAVIAESENVALKRAITECHDPLHMNDVQVLKTDSQAHLFPDGKVGDLLVSLRNANAIILLDRDSHRIKWELLGLFSRQHSPRISSAGTLLVFDNLGSDEPNGRSRIVEIDIASKHRIGVWEATGKDFFESKLRGKITEMGSRLVIQQQDLRYTTNSMFILECPQRPISTSCKKTIIFTAEPPSFGYDNAVFLPPETVNAPANPAPQ